MNAVSEPIGVSSYLDQVNAGLLAARAKIMGEVCEIKEYPGRSYLYFSIKDKTEPATMNCFMWKTDYRTSGVELRDGLEVVLTAYPKIYKPNGTLSLQVESIELVGEGALKIAYEKLKKKLEAEGLFSPERKRELPSYPHTIGVITSKSGAVIGDFLSNIGKFGFEILFVNSKVEGREAVRDLLAAIETLRTKDIDVLVLMRGGGSLESFQAFNNEAVVRALASFPSPTLTGIGHDKDAPLVSLVSDRNVSTPTAAANLLSAGWLEARSLVRLAEEKMLLRLESRIARIAEKISESPKELVRSMTELVKRAGDFLKQMEKTLELVSPERALSRGYSIVRSKGKIIRSTKDTRSGDKLDILVSDGSMEAHII